MVRGCSVASRSFTLAQNLLRTRLVGAAARAVQEGVPRESERHRRVLVFSNDVFVGLAGRAGLRKRPLCGVDPATKLGGRGLRPVATAAGVARSLERVRTSASNEPDSLGRRRRQMRRRMPHTQCVSFHSDPSRRSSCARAVSASERRK